MTEAALLQDRVWGCLFGGAIGDAFGYPIEFWSRERIQATYGPNGLLEPVPSGPAGRYLVSDDTQMTMFTLEGLLLACGSGLPQSRRLESIRLAYLDWLDTQEGGSASRRRAAAEDGAGEAALAGRSPGRLVHLPVMRHSRAPGATCLSALRVGGRGTPTSPVNNSKGCGGVMRVAPIGLLLDLSPDEAFDLAARAAALTHGHPGGYLSAGFMAAVVRLLVEGASLREAVAVGVPLLQRWRGHEETLAAVEAAVAAGVETRNCRTGGAGRADVSAAGGQASAGRMVVPLVLGQGWIGEEALAIAVWAALVGCWFAEVVRLAANHDGDSDSTASIAGQLWGAEHGREGIPEEWARGLDVGEELEGLVERFEPARWASAR